MFAAMRRTRSEQTLHREPPPSTTSGQSTSLCFVGGLSLEAERRKALERLDDKPVKGKHPEAEYLQAECERFRAEYLKYASGYATTSRAVEPVEIVLPPEGPPCPSPRYRTVLPMVFEKTTVLSIPDTGSEENLMTLAFADQVGLAVDDAPCHRKEFRLGNGKIITALGRVRSLCSFAKDRSVETMSEFYVLGHAIVDVIMGMSFLDATETLTKHKHRLERLTAPKYGTPRLMAMNNPRCRMKCAVESHRGALEVLANADTGSEMNLVSSKFVAEQGLAMVERGPTQPKVQFADGSTAHLAGRTRIRIRLGSDRKRGIDWASVELVEFYVLDDLTAPMILGEDILDANEAFATYSSSLVVEANPAGAAEASTIFWANTLERFWLGSGPRQTQAPPPFEGGDDSTAPRRLAKRALDGMKRILRRVRMTAADPEAAASSHGELPPGWHQDKDRMQEQDARESHRRALARYKIAEMSPGAAQSTARAEEERRVMAYEANKALVGHRRRQQGGT